METTVQLIDWPRYPMETLFVLWEASRKEDPQIPTPEWYSRKRKEDPELDAEIRNLFFKIVDSGIPVAENLNFTFILDHVSIELREQLVRHRIGLRVGERLGMDMIPNLPDSTWWSQSMRVLNMGRFFTDRHYRMPESVAERCTCSDFAHSAQLTHDLQCPVTVFRRALGDAENVYNHLVKLGVPLEDARGVIPLAATHRISWTLNLATIKHIIGKRGCWILQLGIWEPVIRGMVRELAEKVDASLRRLIDPPCFESGKFVGCKFKLDNEQRCASKDPLPPCSLYLGKNQGLSGDWEQSMEKRAKYKDLKEKYRLLWQRDPDTGEPIDGLKQTSAR